ncbi:MAG: response regulator [Candidatus Nitrotoga sp.]
MKKIKVLLVDDSAVVRQVLQAVLDREPGIHVIVTASDPIFAMQKRTKEWQDVIVLDVEMPRMGGITFLNNYGQTPHTGGDLFHSHGKRYGNHHADAYRWSS